MMAVNVLGLHVALSPLLPQMVDSSANSRLYQDKNSLVFYLLYQN